MFFGTTKRGMNFNILFLIFGLFVILVMFILIGHNEYTRKQVAPTPASYTVREAENNVYIFEYNPGNQKSHISDNLTLFTDALNSWIKDHPGVSIICMECFNTPTNYKTVDNKTLTYVNVLLYAKK